MNETGREILFSAKVNGTKSEAANYVENNIRAEQSDMDGCSDVDERRCVADTNRAFWRWPTSTVSDSCDSETEETFDLMAFVRKHPLMCSGVVLAGGFLIGRICRR